MSSVEVEVTVAIVYYTHPPQPGCGDHIITQQCEGTW